MQAAFEGEPLPAQSSARPSMEEVRVRAPLLRSSHFSLRSRFPPRHARKDH